jgi:regulatory protein
MDSGELERSTSSPSAKLHILRITEGAAGKQVKIELTDGSSFYVPPSIVLEHSLHEGTEVTEELCRLLSEETIALAAYEKAVDYLARREHSRFELQQKLRKKEFPPDAVRRALDACEERGYLDDERFARLWSEQRIRRKPEGPRLLAAKLEKKGVSHDIVDKVVEELFTEELVWDTLHRAVEKGRRKAGDDPEKLKKFLLSRGFLLSQINEYMR